MSEIKTRFAIGDVVSYYFNNHKAGSYGKQVYFGRVAQVLATTEGISYAMETPSNPDGLCERWIKEESVERKWVESSVPQMVNRYE